MTGLGECREWDQASKCSWETKGLSSDTTPILVPVKLNGNKEMILKSESGDLGKLENNF